MPRLLAFSRLAADGVDGPMGAIVLPPVQIEVVNTNYWPDFPWAELGSLYDVWLPMSYWSFRSGQYGDGYTYHEESVRRLRSNLGRPRSPSVHGIGGIGGIGVEGERGAAALGTRGAISDIARDTGFHESVGRLRFDRRFPYTTGAH